MIANHISDIIHGGLVAFICIAATIYALVAKDHSDNIWIVYGSAVAFAAGRAGVATARTVKSRVGDDDSKIH